MLIYRGFLYAKAIAGTNAFIFSINAKFLAAMHTVFWPTSKSACKTRHAKPNCRIGLRSIIGVGQAFPLDCFKVKGTTVTELEAAGLCHCKAPQYIAASDINRPGAA